MSAILHKKKAPVVHTGTLGPENRHHILHKITAAPESQKRPQFQIPFNSHFRHYRRQRGVEHCPTPFPSRNSISRTGR